MSKITIPWPAAALWPNHRSRKHWGRTKALKKAREMAFWLTKEAKIGVVAGEVPVQLRITVHPRNSRRQCQPDYDAVTSVLKPYFDGMADALGVNDRCFRPEPPIFAEVIKGGKMVIEVL